MANMIDSLSKELNKAQDIIRQIASMGHDSTDKEIADEAIKIARQYVNWEIISPSQIKTNCGYNPIDPSSERKHNWFCSSCCGSFDIMPTICPVNSPGCNELLAQGK
jgi:hypothetical protein